MPTALNFLYADSFGNTTRTNVLVVPHDKGKNK